MKKLIKSVPPSNVCLALLAIVCFAFGFSHPVVWFVPGINHLLFSFSHANIFHLLANVFALALLRKPVGWVAFLAASVASFLPMSSTPTLGLSALLFAHIGSTWAPSRGFTPMCRKVLPFAVLVGLLPGVNLLIHIYALFLGYLFSLFFSKPFDYGQNLSRPQQPAV